MPRNFRFLKRRFSRHQNMFYLNAKQAIIIQTYESNFINTHKQFDYLFLCHNRQRNTR